SPPALVHLRTLRCLSTEHALLNGGQGSESERRCPHTARVPAATDGAGTCGCTDPFPHTTSAHTCTHATPTRAPLYAALTHVANHGVHTRTHTFTLLDKITRGHASLLMIYYSLPVVVVVVMMMMVVVVVV
ncbi:unnamed protein product, partial [Lampetra fluviatilis]